MGALAKSFTPKNRVLAIRGATVRVASIESSISLTLWGDLAKSFTHHNRVLAIRGATVRVASIVRYYLRRYPLLAILHIQYFTTTICNHKQ